MTSIVGISVTDQTHAGLNPDVVLLLNEFQLARIPYIDVYREVSDELLSASERVAQS